MDASKIPLWRVPKRIAYVLSHTYPYSTNGYAVRSHGIAKALVKHGHSVIAVTRPGRPWDLPGFSTDVVPACHNLDQVRYLYQQLPSRRTFSEDEWLEVAAAALEKTFRIFKPSIVMAASNWETALPALNVARKLAIPFFYEVRGFWEITRLSREPEWESTAAFRDSVDKETLVACSAQRVFTLNRNMRDELIRRGVESSKIDLVPNAWDGMLPITAKSEEVSMQRGTKYVVGYVGSFSAYEGLDDLVRACAAARQSGLDLSLLLVGSSSPVVRLEMNNVACKISSELTKLAESLAFGPYFHLAGRVSPEELGPYYNQIDLIVIPRKAVPICEMVPPIKPLEAAAYGKPMLVSDVAGLNDVVQEAKAGVFRKSDVHHLEQNIRLLLLDEGMRRVMGDKAREWIKTERTFQRVVEPMFLAFGGPNRVSFPIIEKEQTSLTLQHWTTSPDCTTTEAGTSLKISIDKSKKNILSAGSSAIETDDISLFKGALVHALRTGGTSSLEMLLANRIKSMSKKSAALFKIHAANALLSEGFVESAVQMTDAALQEEPNKSTLRGAAKIFHDAVFLDRAVEISKRFLSLVKEASPTDKKLFAEVQSKKQLVDWAMQPPGACTVTAVQCKVLNILAFSLPFTSVGYATRSHGLAIGIKRAGWDIRPYTRPGFPYDFKPELVKQTLAEYDEIDGLIYRRIFDIGRRGWSETEYLTNAIQQWERVIELERPAIVHAASNYVTALPALIAARRKGIPFIYEVRGFWEVTRSSRDCEFSKTPKYRIMQFFERLVALNSDRVLTITQAMKESLVECGVSPDSISIAFNSVDPERFSVMPRNLELARKLGISEDDIVIGYIGTFVDYEGLDDLVTACAGLVKNNIQFRLLLVGDGAQLEPLRQQVASLGLEGIVQLVGRVPHEEVEAYYSLVDIAPFPRKPWEVCEIVSPLKPFEAMALEKAVVVSNTRALSEIVTNEVNGLHFEKGNVADLQNTLARLCLDRSFRLELGKAARKWILKNRTWDTAGRVCIASYLMAINSEI